MQYVELSCHPYGCRIMQRLLEHCSPAQTEGPLAQLLARTDHLLLDQSLELALLGGVSWQHFEGSRTLAIGSPEQISLAQIEHDQLEGLARVPITSAGHKI